MQTHLLLMFPHLLHLVHLSNPDELCDLHLKLILMSHDQLENLETVSRPSYHIAGLTRKM